MIAIDTGYGVLAWKLRSDDRVEVMERTNALHAPGPPDKVDLVVIDLAWTPQRKALPAAREWLAEGGRVVTLIKPHYELREERKHLLEGGFLPQEHAPQVLQEVLDSMGELGFQVLQSTQSPLVGGKSSRKRGVPGNLEYLALLEPSDTG